MCVVVQLRSVKSEKQKQRDSQTIGFAHQTPLNNHQTSSQYGLQEEQQYKQVKPVLNGEPQSNQAQCKHLKLTCSLFCCCAWMTSSLSPSGCCRGSRSGSARRLGCIKRKSAGSSWQRKQQLQFVQCRIFMDFRWTVHIPAKGHLEWDKEIQELSVSGVTPRHSLSSFVTSLQH